MTEKTGRMRRDAGVVERGSLENYCALTGTQGSNPCLSATQSCPCGEFPYRCSKAPHSAGFARAPSTAETPNCRLSAAFFAIVSERNLAGAETQLTGNFATFHGLHRDGRR